MPPMKTSTLRSAACNFTLWGVCGMFIVCGHREAAFVIMGFGLGWVASYWSYRD